MVNIYRGLQSVFSLQRGVVGHSEDHTLTLCCFYLLSCLSEYYSRDLTMLGYFCLFSEKNLLNLKKKLHWRKRRNVSEQYCLINVLLNKPFKPAGSLSV